MDDEILAVVEPSGPRRALGVVAMLALGGMVIYLALAAPPTSLFWRLFLFALGAVALWAAHRLQRATASRLMLTQTALTDSDGTVLAEMEDIAGVDRGMLASKPSNGFVLRLKKPGPRAWRPGLWWRLGKRVAVGGVTSGAQTKPMADIISAILAEREQDG